jgi:hypothetical protein
MILLPRPLGERVGVRGRLDITEIRSRPHWKKTEGLFDRDWEGSW